MRGIVSAAEADRIVAVQPLPQRRSERDPGGFAAILQRAALRCRQRFEPEYLVVGAGLHEIAVFFFVLAGAATADHDESLVLQQQ